MKIKLKNKILLAGLAGGMLCANSALATNFTYKVDDGDERPWDGTTDLKLNELGDGTGVKLEVWGEGAGSSNSIFGGYDSSSGTIAVKTVIFNSGSVNSVYGGHSFSGDVYANTVIINDGKINNNVYGGYSTSGDAEMDEVTISNGTVGQNVYGDYGGSCTAKYGTVTVSGGSVGQNIYGGYSNSCDATWNEVTVSDGTVGQNVYGGYSPIGDTTDNTVIISGGSAGYVYGGDSHDDHGNATRNTVTISGGAVTHVYGGYSYSGEVTENTIIISDGMVSDLVRGGFSYDGSVTGNAVAISGGSVGSVVGGFTNRNNNANENKVTISGGVIKGNIYGAHTLMGGVNKNVVTISGGTFFGSVGANEIYVYGGHSSTSGTIATGNEVTISNAIFKTASTGNKIYGAAVSGENGQANNNKVTIKNGSFTDASVFGIEIVGGNANNSGNATGNAVEIYSGTFIPAGTGKITIMGGVAASNVNSNSVTIKNGVFQGAEIFGGKANGVSSGNKVIIYDGTFNGAGDNKIYGGYITGITGLSDNEIVINGGIFSKAKIIAAEGSAIAQSNNKITIAGTKCLDLSGAILMGYESSGSPTGKILDVKRIDVAVEGVQNFKTFNFNLKVTDPEFMVLKSEMPVALSGVDVTANLNGLSLANNDYIVLVQNVNGTGFDAPSSNYQILNIAGTDCLVYKNSATDVTAKADFDIISGGVKSVTGNTYYNDGTGTTDTIANTNKTYEHQIQGNVNFADGTATTSYSGNKIIVRRGEYSGIQMYGAYYDGDSKQNVTGNMVTVYNGTFNEDSEIYGGYTNNGNATGNMVTVYNGTFSGDGEIYGGYTNNGNATRNTVTISSGMINIFIYGGYIHSGNGNATENKVAISDGVIDGKVYGGYSDSGNATGNKVNISGGSVSNRVDGGYSKTGDAIGNAIAISGGMLDYEVYGGESDYGNATENIVNISGGMVGEMIYGGCSNDGNAVKNIVNIRGGIVNHNVYGGYSDYGNANENTVNISGGAFGEESKIYGGHSNNGNVTGNTVTINACTVTYVYGGYINAGNSNAIENIVNIGSGMVNGVVYGGCSDSGDAIENIVNISGGIVNHDVYGGYSDSGDVTENIVNISGGAFGEESKIYGGHSNSDNVTGNTVNISSTTIDIVYGGHSDNGDVAENIVNISGGLVELNVYGGRSSNGTATENAANISGGMVTADVHGGYSDSGNATKNIVNISGGVVAGDIYGGYSNSGNATKNTVTISGGGITGNIYGGWTTSGISSNNTLNMETPIGSTAESVAYFQKMNFTVPKGITSDAVMLKSGVAVALSGVDVTANLNGLSLANNDYIVLVQNVDDAGFDAPSSNYQILNIAGKDCLVYANGTAVAKADFDIISGGVKSVTGNTYYNDGTGTTDTIANTNKTYAHQIQGNVNVADGTATTSYKGNKIIVRRGEYSGIQMYGAYYDGDSKQNVTGNMVTVYDGTFSEDSEIYGGYSKSGNVTNNTVTINGGSFIETCSISGGKKNEGDGAVTGNTVTVSYGSFGECTCIYAGYNYDSNGDVANNTITITNSSFGEFFAFGGGTAGNGKIFNNTITISNSSFGANATIMGGNYDGSGGGSVINNKVIISDSGFGDEGMFEAGSGCNTFVRYNTLIINSGNFGAKWVFAGGWTGYSDASYNGYSDASYNTLTISSGNFGDGNVFYGGWSMESDAINNTLTINDGNFGSENKFLGGYGGNSATGNTLRISGGNFGEGSIFYGGESDSSGTSVVDGNIVEISGGSFGDGFLLYGGYNSDGTSSNNILNLKTKIKGKASHVAFFQKMNFTLPANIGNGDIMLSTSSLFVDTKEGLATVNVYAANGVKLNKDDVITLVDSDSTVDTDTFIGGNILGGVATFCSETDIGEDINEDGDINDLVITLLKDFEQKSSAGNNYDQQKAPVEGIAAAAAMLNQSADLVLGEGLASLLANTLQTEEKETEPANENNSNIATSPVVNTFGAVTANRSKYKTGSHVDMDGWGMLVGAGTTKNWSNCTTTTYGVFFEYGKGDFDTYNNDIHGEGDSNNKGVGVIARHTLKNNTYIDGAVRYGKQETEWSESEIGGYDTDSRYYGVALGLGHIYPLGKNEIDIYGRYSFGHTGASDAKVGDNNYHFDSVKSHRLRVGTKLNIIVKGKKVKPYVGLAWEHEFNGESRASITGAGEAPAPSLKGHTGIMQAGCSWETGKWTLGAEANAYIGKRKGWAGMVNAFYNF